MRRPLQIQQALPVKNQRGQPLERIRYKKSMVISLLVTLLQTHQYLFFRFTQLRGRICRKEMKFE